MAATVSQTRPQATPAKRDLNADAWLWLSLLLGAGLMWAAILVLGEPVGSVFFKGHGLRAFPVYLSDVLPKPTTFGRFGVAILVVLVVAAAIATLPRISSLGALPAAAQRLFGRLGPVIVASGQLAVLAVAVWAWGGQNRGVNLRTPIQFHTAELLVALVIAAALALMAVLGLLRWMAPARSEPRRYLWTAAAVLITALWLTPALYRASNLGHSLPAVWYPLQFTFDDFASVLNGRTPLVNYDTQYASLLPFVTEPVLKLLGTTIGAFTATMGALSLISFICVERALAIVARNERTALLLYVPLLAISLFTLQHAGDERYFMANYYAVIPMRYAGPCVLFWGSVRHLRGLRPRRPLLLFLLGGLVVINNTEFGIPALAGCLLALATAELVPRPGSWRWIPRLLGELLLGLLAAVVVVSLFTLLRAGSLPQLSRLTRYEQIYGITGFNMSSTPDAGLHVIIFMTFVAALVVSAVRVRGACSDRALTGALAFSGMFGMGAGSYYMGRSLPEVLSALFLAWAIATALLCLVAFQALADPASRRRICPTRILPIAGALVLLGLLVTAIPQFPAPWTQWQRLSRNKPMPLFTPIGSVRFIQSVTHPGERVVVLRSLGHVIATDARVVNVSPYSNPDGIITFEQLDDVVGALRASHGERLFTDANDLLPEIGQALRARGFHVIAADPPSATTEWLAPASVRP